MGTSNVSCKNIKNFFTKNFNGIYVAVCLTKCADFAPMIVSFDLLYCDYVKYLTMYYVVLYCSKINYYNTLCKVSKSHFYPSNIDIHVVRVLHFLTVDLFAGFLTDRESVFSSVFRPFLSSFFTSFTASFTF